MKKIKSIAHIADVHIRNNSRRKEFYAVVQNLVSSLKKKKPDLIFVAGDLFDAKTILSPELNTDVTYFIDELLKLADVIFVDGNHDFNGSNEERESSFEYFYNVFSRIKTKHTLHYYVKSGLYDYEDLCFGIFSIRKNSGDWPKTFTRKDDVTYIASYHGPVNGSKSESGQDMINNNVDVTLFSEYDFTLLGDIHLRQDLDDEGRVAYPGSLYQQNFGESGQKGYLFWNVEQRTKEFIAIDNPYEFVTVHVMNIADVQTVLESKNIESTTRLRIQIEGSTTKNEREDLKLSLAKEYGLTDLHIQSFYSPIENYIQEHEENMLNYSDKSYQLNLLKSWLETANYGDNYIDECSKIHLDLLNQITLPDLSKNRWKLKKLIINAIGVYDDDDNELDFSLANGIIGIFSDNRSGKSTIINALSFVLHGGFLKEIPLYDCLNYFKSKGEAVALIEMSGSLYRITRTLKRSKTDNVSSSVNFEQLVGGEWTEINEDTPTKTKQKIKEFFGSQDDLVTTAIAAQRDVLGIIESKQTARLETLYRFANLSFFDQLHRIAVKQYDEALQKSQLLTSFSNAETYEKTKKEYVAIEETNEKIYTTLTQKKDHIAELQTQLPPLFAQIKEFDTTTVEEISAIENEKFTLEKSVAMNEQLLAKERNKFITLTNTVKTNKEIAKKILGDHKSKDIIPLKQQAIDLEKELVSIANKVKTETDSKQRIERQISIIEKQEWVYEDPNCKKCMFLQDAWKEKEKYDEVTTFLESLLSEQKNVKESLEKIGFSSTDIQKIEQHIITVNLTKKELETCELQISNYEKEIELLTLQLSEKHAALQKYNAIFLIEEENDTIKHQIIDVEMNIKYALDFVKEQEAILFKNASEMARLNGQMESIQENITKLLSLEKEMDNLQAYIKATDKKGIPFFIIKTLLPKINAEINHILGTTQKWKIVIKIEDDKLFINIIDEINGQECERLIEAGSGAEQTITAIALRIALTRISALPKPDFIIFDESFGEIDQKSLPLIKTFLHDIKRIFDFILVISHELLLTDFVDYKIVVDRQDNGFARLSM